MVLPLDEACGSGTIGLKRLFRTAAPPSIRLQVFGGERLAGPGLRRSWMWTGGSSGGPHRKPYAPYWLGLWLLLVALPNTARAETRTVLGSGAVPALEAACAALPADLTLADAKVFADRADLQICRGATECAAVHLSSPEGPCRGDQTPAFCVDFGPPKRAFAPQILTMLQRVPPSVWQRTSFWRASTLPQHRMWVQLGLWLAVLALIALASHRVWGAMVAAAGVAAALLAWMHVLTREDRDWAQRRELIALGWEANWWLVPAVLGLLVGGLARRFPRARRLWVALPLLLALVPLWWRPFSFGDALPMGLLGLAVAVWQSDARPRRGQRWLLGLTSLTLGAWLLELALHVVPRPPPVIDDARIQLLLTGFQPGEPEFDASPLSPEFPAEGVEAYCADALFVPPDAFRVLRARRPDRPWLMHIGDSMLFGSGIDAQHAVPAQLQELLPQWAHVNAGVPGTTLDIQFALITRLLQAWPKPDAVVLHAYRANDLHGLDVPIGNCGGRPPLTPSGQPVEVRCTAYEPSTALHRLRNAPMPLPLARAAQWSWLARRIGALQAVFRTTAEPVQSGDAKLRYFEIAAALARTLQQQRIPFVVVGMPARRTVWALPEQDPLPLREGFARLGMTVLESQPVIDARVAETGEATIFVSQRDIHLNEQGAQLYARWLAPLLQQALSKR